MKFSSSLAGNVTGLRFYKSAANTGTHTGTLWSATGQQLATGTFTGESASGWQTLTFATPVSIAANTQYVVSYHAPSGHYAADAGYFGTVHNYYPLTAAASVNGLFSYGSTSAFPTNTYNGTNYWIDPIFQTTAPAQNPAASPLRSPSMRVSGGQTATTGDAVVGAGRIALRQDPVMDPNHPITTVLPATADPSTVKMTVVTAAPLPGQEWQPGTVMPGYVTFDRATHVVAFHPSGLLPRSGTYRVTVTANVDNDDPTPPLTWVIAPTTVYGGGSPVVPGQGTPVGVAPGVLPGPSYGSRSNRPGIR